MNTSLCLSPAHAEADRDLISAGGRLACPPAFRNAQQRHHSTESCRMTNRIVLLWCCAWIACLQLPPACASEERTVTAVPYLTANDLLEKFRLRRQFLLAARLFLNLPPASPHDHQHLLPLRQPGGERCESPVAALHGGRKPLDPRQEPLRETRLFPVAHGTTKTLFSGDSAARRRLRSPPKARYGILRLLLPRQLSRNRIPVCPGGSANSKALPLPSRRCGISAPCEWASSLPDCAFPRSRSESSSAACRDLA